MTVRRCHCKKSVLVVDDDPELFSQLQSKLPSGEWSIEREGSGDRALPRLAARKFGVVLAALGTPETGVVEFVRGRQRIRPGVKVIVPAAATTPADVIGSIKAPAFAHFSKPFDAEMLAQTIVRAADTPAWTDGIEILPASPQWIDLRVRCKLVTAGRLVRFFREMKLDLPPEEHEGIATAFREMPVNAMEHGGQLHPDQTVDVSYMRTQHSLIYCIDDPGDGFSPDQLPHAAISNPDDAPSKHLLYRMEHGMRAGGFGIPVAHKLVDELLYNDRGNKALLVKYLKNQPS